MRDAVICIPVRTPVGRMGGVLSSVTASELATSVIQYVVKTSGINPYEIDDVVLGQAFPNGEAPAIGRVAALDAGMPVEVTGLQLDRRCGSGLQAVIYAAMEVQTGSADIVLAGGVDSMSRVEFYSEKLRQGKLGNSVELHDRLARARVTPGGAYYPVPGGMLETAENLRREYRISRQEQDEYSLRSHERAVDAQRRGAFDDEVVPVVANQKGLTIDITLDEHPRSDTSLERLARLRPILIDSDDEATVTAGNSSGQNDAAALCLVTHAEKAHQLGLQPFVRIVSWAHAGVAPNVMGLGPVPATARALQRANLSMSDIDLVELNEAFAAQVIAVTREWNFAEGDFDRMNVNGSGISLGHPVGATGARILATLSHEMRRRGVRYGLETMCIGGGQGLTAIFENVTP